jgi:hypothetical protein
VGSGFQTRGGRFKSSFGQPIVQREATRGAGGSRIHAWKAHGGQEQETVSRAGARQATGLKRSTPALVSPAWAQGATKGGAWSAIT